MNSADVAHNIRANFFGSEPYLSASPTNIYPNLVGHNEEDRKHQPGPKSKPGLNFSYHYLKSLPDHRVASSSFLRDVQKDHDGGQTYI